MLLSVCGNIGVGKTTFAKYFVKEFREIKPKFQIEESDMENPFLNHFYNDMERWSFALQTWFLTNRCEVLFQKKDANIIMDRSLFEEKEIFAGKFRDEGLMSNHEFILYEKIFNMLLEKYSAQITPILNINLFSSLESIRSNIEKRGRKYEQSIDFSYIADIQSRYEKYWHNKQKLALPYRAKSKELYFNLDEMGDLHSLEVRQQIYDSISLQIF